MSAIEFVQYFSQLLYVLIFLDVLIEAIRRPLRTNVDVALLFGVASTAVALGWWEQVLGVQPGPLLSAVSGALIMLLPFFLVRLLDDFAGISGYPMRLSEVGIVVALVTIFVIPQPYPALLIVFDVVYFLGFEIYGAIVVVDEARQSRGVTQRRMQAVALGSSFLGLTILMSGLQNLLPGASSTWVVLGQVLALASGVGYFLGFAPPRWLRRAWQAPELRTFLSNTAKLVVVSDVDVVIQTLETGAAQSLGASGAAIGLYDEQSQSLQFGGDGRSTTIPLSGSLSGRAFVEQRTLLSGNLTHDHASLADLYRQAEASAALYAPITSGSKRLGILVVYAHRVPIFADSDLDLIRLLADQTAVILENRVLFEEASRSRARAEALAAAEAERRRLYAVLLDSPAATCQYRGPDHVIEFANARYLQIVGRQSDVGGSSQEAPPKIAAPSLANQLDQVYRTGERIVTNEQCVALDRRGDGSIEEAFFNFVYQPTYDAAGNVDGILVHGFDVTEQVRTREAVEHAADRISRLQTVTAGLSERRSPTDVARLVVTQAIDVLHARMGTIARLANGGAIFEVLWEEGYPGEQSEIPEALSAWQRFPVALATPFGDVVRSGEPVFIESREDRATRYPQLGNTQDSIDLSAGASLPLLVGGRVIGAMYLNFGETRTFSDEDRAFLLALARQCAQALERARLDEAERQARVEAEAARERVARILESIRDRFIAMDRSWRFTYINREAESFFKRRLGKTRDQLLGKNFWAEFPGLTDSDVYHAYLRAVAEKTTVELEEYSPDLDEWIHIRAYPSDDGLSVYFEDVTERKHAENEIKRLNADLRRRTIELEAANKELEAFSYSVAHDLRAPLRAIDGFSRILIDEHGPALEPEAQRYLQVVRANAQQMGELIDDLLSFSRLSRQPLAKRPVDPTEIVRQLLAELEESRQGRRVTVSIGDLGTCSADPALLKLVYLNLLANALKFTRRREEATIEVGSQEDGEERVYWVKDNGVGFDTRYAHKLFGVFQRLHRPEEYEGTGVGLAIVQRIVHRHGGRVWAEAELDRGATFYFTIGGSGNGNA